MPESYRNTAANEPIKALVAPQKPGVILLAMPQLEIEDEKTVFIFAVRRQREEYYH